MPINASLYQHFDILYVMDGFPELDRDVATRLGKLISRRQQILFYRESHGKNLDTARVQPRIAISTIPSKSSANARSEAGSSSQLACSDAASGKFSLRSKATTSRLPNIQAEKDINALYALLLPIPSRLWRRAMLEMICELRYLVV